MGKIENAVRKVNHEIQKAPDDGYIAAVGEHIIDCIISEEAADAVLTEGKTLSGALEKVQKAMRERAEKMRSANKREGCVGLAVEREEVFRMAREYFGLPEPGACPEPEKGVRLSLEDFL